jgi:hypothetical protein
MKNKHDHKFFSSVFKALNRTILQRYSTKKSNSIVFKSDYGNNLLYEGIFKCYFSVIKYLEKEAVKKLSMMIELFAQVYEDDARNY